MWGGDKGVGHVVEGKEIGGMRGRSRGGSRVSGHPPFGEKFILMQITLRLLGIAAALLISKLNSLSHVFTYPISCQTGF